MAQQVVGMITDSNDSLITNASVEFKEIKNPSQIVEFLISRNGKFRYSLKKEYQTLLIEVKATGYTMKTFEVFSPKKDSTYQFVVKLEKRVIHLQEVKVAAKKFPFQIHGDTVSFNVSAYKDVSDRKIQDIIKKLPGIEVNEKSGEIKYRGKSVETVLLEGDNLFDYNYTVGTKNINVGMVEQIQAIDNFAANPLLKGIEREGKVALNLKLKKGKFDFSGSGDGGLGFFDNGAGLARYVNSTLLGITSNYKSFGGISFNNIGINDSPNDYFSNTRSIEQINENNELAEKIQHESNLSTFINDERVNINNQIFGNYNQLVKLNKNVSLKTNLSYQKDHIRSAQYTGIYSIVGSTIFEAYDSIQIDKKPVSYRGDLRLIVNLSKKALLEYDIRYKFESVETPSLLTTNIVSTASSALSTRDYFFKQRAVFTQKISDLQAVQCKVTYSVNNIPQTSWVKPAFWRGGTLTTLRQESQFKHSNFLTDLVLLGKRDKQKYVANAGFEVRQIPFSSTLFVQNNDADTIRINSQNQFQYSLYRAYMLLNYHYSLGKFVFSPSASLTNYAQTISNDVHGEDNSQNTILLLPTFSTIFRINNHSSLTGRVTLDQQPNTANYFFNNEVLVGHRTLVTNIPDLRLQVLIS